MSARSTAALLAILLAAAPPSAAERQYMTSDCGTCVTVERGGMTFVVAECERPEDGSGCAGDACECQCRRPWIGARCGNVLEDPAFPRARGFFLTVVFGLLTPLYLLLTGYTAFIARGKARSMLARDPHARPCRSPVLGACLSMTCFLACRLLYFAIDPAHHFSVLPQAAVEFFYRMGQPFMFVTLVLVIDSWGTLVKTRLKMTQRIYGPKTPCIMFAVVGAMVVFELAHFFVVVVFGPGGGAGARRGADGAEAGDAGSRLDLTVANDFLMLWYAVVGLTLSGHIFYWGHRLEAKLSECERCLGSCGSQIADFLRTMSCYLTAFSVLSIAFCGSVVLHVAVAFRPDVWISLFCAHRALETSLAWCLLRIIEGRRQTWAWVEMRAALHRLGVWRVGPRPPRHADNRSLSRWRGPAREDAGAVARPAGADARRVAALAAAEAAPEAADGGVKAAGAPRAAEPAADPGSAGARGPRGPAGGGAETGGAEPAAAVVVARAEESG
jgi:hypothetical protein